MSSEAIAQAVSPQTSHLSTRTSSLRVEISHDIPTSRSLLSLERRGPDPLDADRLHLVSGFDQIKWDTAPVAGRLSPHRAAHIAFQFRVLRCFIGNSHLLGLAKLHTYSHPSTSTSNPRSITSLHHAHPTSHIFTINQQTCVSTPSLSTHKLCVTTRTVPGRPNRTDSALQSPQGTAV